MIDFLGMLGLFGTVVSGIQGAVLEHAALSAIEPGEGGSVAWLVFGSVPDRIRTHLRFQFWLYRTLLVCIETLLDWIGHCLVVSNTAWLYRPILAGLAVSPISYFGATLGSLGHHRDMFVCAYACKDFALPHSEPHSESNQRFL
jgi:hypothetical protein